MTFAYMMNNMAPGVFAGSIVAALVERLYNIVNR
jgi:hypothetical protein